MDYKNHTIKNILKDRSIPDFIKQEYPLFVNFIEYYIEWLEEEKNPLDISNNFNYYTFLNSTLEEFKSKFENLYINSIPKDIQSDKTLLIKIIKTFYLNKGNEESYKFIFNALYGSRVGFYYPKNDILRLSDGKWEQKTSVKITTDSELLNYSSVLMGTVTGVSSGAIATIEESYRYVERGENIYEIFFRELKGNFISRENVILNLYDYEGNEFEFEESLYECFIGVEITVGGSGYSSNQNIDILDSYENKISSASIGKADTAPVSALTLVDGGLGYSGLYRRTDIFGLLTPETTFDGDYLDSVAVDGSDSTSSGNDYSLYSFDEVIPSIDIFENNPDLIRITDSVGFGTGAYGRVDLVSTYGTILEISLIYSGQNYSTPIATVESSSGSGADISAIGGNGSIGRCRLNSFPIVLDSVDYDSGEDFIPYPNFTTVGDGNAIGNMISGSVIVYNGVFLNEDGFLSTSSKKLQDNYYYQDYSYVIKSSVQLEKRLSTIENIIHPAGMIVFGELIHTGEITTQNNIEVAQRELILL